MNKGKLSVTAPSRSASLSTAPSRSASASLSRPASAVASRQASRNRTEDGVALTDDDNVILATLLGIPLHLIGGANRSKGNIQEAYAIYKLILKADAKRIRNMATLPKRYTLNDIIQLFMSPSAYYNNSHKIFSKLGSYPEMEKWLQNDEDAPTRISVWGTQKPSFEHLNEILDDRAALSQAGSSKAKKSHKGGKKRKAEDEEKEKERKKRSKSKDKAKKRSKE